MQDMISAARAEINTKEHPNNNNLDGNNTNGSITDRTHRRNPSMLPPFTTHTQRNSSCVSFNFNYDFDKACVNQRDKTGVQKKKYFSYDNSQ